MIGIAESNTGVMDKTRDQIEIGNIQYLLASFSDMEGTLRAKLVPSGRLSSVCDSGAGFAGFAVGDLGHGPSDPDILCIPDLRSMTVLPWQKNVAWFAGTLTEDGTSWPFCPRTILLNVMEKAKKMGYEMHTGIEPEFFLVKENEDGSISPSDNKDISQKPCYQQEALMRNIDFLTTLIDYMDELGWSVTQADHEDANGQFEINFDFADALTSSDRQSFFRYMVRSMAEERGLIATFMPKPFSHLTGNGSHMHLSLWNGSNNLFEDIYDGKGYGLTELAYKFIGGLLYHAKAISAIVCPTVNSYKRLTAATTSSGSTWAPNYIAYGGNDRTQFIRIPESGRIEFRAMDGACNPYLATAAILAAGLDGIEKDIDPGEPFAGTDSISSNPIEKGNILPTNLKEALTALEQDDVIIETLGADFVNTFLHRKKEEWREYHHFVSAWEINKYLKGC
ncbi:type III glutamate--ammonia ligase [Alteribacillus sp. YIM 98480]|uniref:type III glutamate--ammonia ligase n=1 Tax=Alteribacillus sp. YIM 98480 TaxID=2606599 RepID=UPI0018EF0C28|nr:type III glutamate--ammonia ligase [Alteribacillus sp. YIM 98480]